MPIVISFNSGKSMSKIVFSISLQFRVFVLKINHFLNNKQHRRLNSIWRTVWLSFYSVIPIIVARVLLAMHFNSSIFRSKLFILIWRKCKPFLLSGSQILVFTAGDIRTSSRFRLTSLESSKKNWWKCYRPCILD